jgi:Flp pilus assembly pilin Flp
MLMQYQRLKSLFGDKRGQASVDYCIMVAMLVFALIAASPNFIASIQSFFTGATTSLISGIASALCLILLIRRAKNKKAHR